MSPTFFKRKRSTPSVVVPGMQCSSAPADVAKFDQFWKENAFLLFTRGRVSRELLGDIFIGTVAADPAESGPKQVFLKVSLRKNIYTSSTGASAAHLYYGTVWDSMGPLYYPVGKGHREKTKKKIRRKRARCFIQLTHNILICLGPACRTREVACKIMRKHKKTCRNEQKSPF